MADPKYRFGVRPDDFSEAARGQLERSLSGAWTFIPAPLPPHLSWTPALIKALSDADRALGQLDGHGSQLQNPHLLIEPFASREAVLSSQIEGTQASLSDLFSLEASQQEAQGDAREVQNYRRALDRGIDKLKRVPITLNLICELHQILMEGVRGQDPTPGRFRTTQNWIGSPGTTIESAAHVPPPPQRLAGCLDAFEKFVNQTSELPALVRMALMHYQFEAIHPFIDGNGRVGRLLITLALCEWKLLSRPLLYLSAWFEQTRSEYYARLSAVSRRGEWNEWLVYVLHGVASQARDAVGRATDLMALRDRMQERVRGTKSAALLQLVDQLFRAPYISVPLAQRVLGQTQPGARNNVIKLVKLGILREARMGKKPQIFVAPEILKILEAVRSPVAG
ncbi:MAG: Fic family protein [Deltaproteobacteria bacterium]|nr:Fic family protein [Deltaproteobacteria bacterium]